jgi:threonine synthase
LTYYSTNRRAPEVSFKEALLRGLAPDGGLYMPGHIPAIGPDILESLRSKSYPEIAADIMSLFIGNEISKNDLLGLCRDSYDFPIPLENIYDNKYILRLDRGPTASFKDFAALLMGRMMQYFLKTENKFLTILTATSGDTGSAVANAFSGLENINVIILYPEKEISPLQRKQMTTLHGNIKVVAIDGKFDDCQQLAKKAFMDKSLSGLNLSSANSINIGRLLPQSVYYFMAWAELASEKEQKVVFSVPSGNFGNVAGGIIAREMGLPVKCFVISTNENDEVPEYLKTGVYKPVCPSKNCISNAMNVGHPGNLPRIIALYGGSMDEKGNISVAPDLGRMRKDLFAVSISDPQTEETMLHCYNDYGIMLEPHGAVAWQGLDSYLRQEPIDGNEQVSYISLETAHPAKFREEMKRILKVYLPLPDSLAKVEKGSEEYISLGNDFKDLKDFIIKNY